MGWLQQVGSQISEVSFAKDPYKKRALLLTKPSYLGSLLAVATYIHLTEVSFAKDPYKKRALLLTKPCYLGSLLAVATYIHLTEVSFAKESYKQEGSFVNMSELQRQWADGCK